MAARLLIISFLLLGGHAIAAPVSLRQAIDLATKNSNAIKLAESDLARSRAGLHEARDAYIPPVYIGSGLAYTNGFPVGEPEIVNISSQSLLLNLAQRQFVRAATTDVRASEFSAQDTRRQVILDTSIAYAQLDAVMATIEILRQQREAASRMEDVVQKRASAGIEQPIEITRVHLNSARIRLRETELRGSADLLRKHLADLTGLAPEGIQTIPESIPPFPSIDQNANLAQEAIDSSASIKAADDQARAKELRALGEHRQNDPSVDFFTQYGLFSTINNYQQFYKEFQTNNLSIGIQIKFPFFNPVQKARADGADAEAFRARREAQGLREQAGSETLRLQRLVAQFQEAEQVAQLDYQLAKSDLDALEIKAGSSPDGPADQPGNGSVTPKDLEAARIAVAEKYSATLDARFDLDRTQLQLLRATGAIDDWARSAKP